MVRKAGSIAAQRTWNRQILVTAEDRLPEPDRGWRHPVIYGGRLALGALVVSRPDRRAERHLIEVNQRQIRVPEAGRRFDNPFGAVARLGCKWAIVWITDLKTYTPTRSEVAYTERDRTVSRRILDGRPNRDAAGRIARVGGKAVSAISGLEHDLARITVGVQGLSRAAYDLVPEIVWGTAVDWIEILLRSCLNQRIA